MKNNHTFKDISPEFMIIWILANAEKNKDVLNYRRFSQIFYFLEDFLRTKGYTTNYHFAERHLGAFDKNLDDDLRMLKNIKLLEIKEEPWKIGGLILESRILLTDIARLYYDKVVYPRIKDLLGKNSVKDLGNIFSKYVAKREGELIDDVLKDLCNKNPEEAEAIKQLYNLQ